MKKHQKLDKIKNYVKNALIIQIKHKWIHIFTYIHLCFGVGTKAFYFIARIRWLKQKYIIKYQHYMLIMLIFVLMQYVGVNNRYWLYEPERPIGSRAGCSFARL